MLPRELPLKLWLAMTSAGDSLPVKNRRRYHELLTAGIAGWREATPDMVTKLIADARRKVGIACFDRLQRPGPLERKRWRLHP
jgi:hypothetical protein